MDQNPTLIKLPDHCSVYTAELTAILHCLEHITHTTPSPKYLILSDSLSSLLSLQNMFTSHPLVQRILLLLNICHTLHISVSFLWIPSHIGITGNELVDSAAKNASHLRRVTSNTTTSSDIKSYLRALISKKWQDLWRAQTTNKLFLIKPDVQPWHSSSQKTRRAEILLTRLRISHTSLTHSYLLERKPPPQCPFCNSDILTVSHILLQCNKLQQQRLKMHLPSSLTNLLSDTTPPYSSNRQISSLH